jgi:hypothetical protein
LVVMMWSFVAPSKLTRVPDRQRRERGELDRLAR